MEIVLFIGIVILAILFSLAALRWGIDSRDDLQSCEWKRRQSFKALHPQSPF